jgi:hypothetical protein
VAIKAGSILHDINGYVIDRIQSGGPGNLNIPEEKIYELGNWNSVATVRDIPDLSFDLESFDMTTEFECILTNKAPGAFPHPDDNSFAAGSNAIDFADHVPIDVISPFKSRRNKFDIVKGLAVPYLTLERASYRFGLRQNAAQSFSLRGDSIFYIPGQPYYHEAAYTGGAGLVGSKITCDHAPILYKDGNKNVRALCVVLVNTETGAYKRLYHNQGSTTDGYSDGVDGQGKLQVWINSASQYPQGPAEGQYNRIRITYGSTTTEDYDPGANGLGLNPQNGLAGNNRVHEDNVSLKPAAIRPRDIDVYIWPSIDGTPTEIRLTGVQSAEVNWSVQLEQDEEFGNTHYVGMDYDTPDVAGSVGLKPFDPADLWEKIAYITGVPVAQVIGPDSSIPLPMEVRINHPDSGARLKTLYVPDARFQVPGLQGRVQSKLETTLSFTSDQGRLKVYNGVKTGS